MMAPVPLRARRSIASASVATRARMAEMAIENLLTALAGKAPIHCVNPEVLTRQAE